MSFIDDIDELVYYEYQEIDHKAYQQRIRYYERNKKAISTLSYEMRLEMTIQYVVSLFEVGDYYAYLKYVDQLLAKVINENVFSIDGDDIYQELLYRKAASYHNIVDYNKADHIFSQLCRIDKQSILYKKTFLKNSMDSLRYRDQKIRAVIISMFLLSGLIIGVELLSIRPFFPELISTVELSRNVLFFGALLGIIFQELRIRYISWKRYTNLISQ